MAKLEQRIAALEARLRPSSVPTVIFVDFVDADGGRGRLTRISCGAFQPGRDALVIRRRPKESEEDCRHRAQETALAEVGAPHGILVLFIDRENATCQGQR